MSCSELDTIKMASLLAGELEEEEKRALLSHIKECRDCKTRFDSLYAGNAPGVAEFGTLPENDAEKKKRKPFSVRSALIKAAAMFIGAVTVFGLLKYSDEHYSPDVRLDVFMPEKNIKNNISIVKKTRSADSSTRLSSAARVKISDGKKDLSKSSVSAKQAFMTAYSVADGRGSFHGQKSYAGKSSSASEKNSSSRNDVYGLMNCEIKSIKLERIAKRGLKNLQKYFDCNRINVKIRKIHIRATRGIIIYCDPADYRALLRFAESAAKD